MTLADISPGDIAQSVAPLTSSNLSLIHLFLHAHWIVESVMVGLLVCSVWVWAIAIDKTMLFARIGKVMDVAIAREIEHMERRLLVLATVGSAGPFIGLFGTVAGIMTSFQSIAASQNTSLAVVAPGIAESLFATAIGLVAAIPATIFYNKFTAEVNRQAQRLEGFADEFSAILSRQIDERG